MEDIYDNKVIPEGLKGKEGQELLARLEEISEHKVSKEVTNSLLKQYKDCIKECGAKLAELKEQLLDAYSNLEKLERQPPLAIDSEVLRRCSATDKL